MEVQLTLSDWVIALGFSTGLFWFAYLIQPKELLPYISVSYAFGVIGGVFIVFVVRYREHKNNEKRN